MLLNPHSHSFKYIPNCAFGTPLNLRMWRLVRFQKTLNAVDVGYGGRQRELGMVDMEVVRTLGTAAITTLATSARHYQQNMRRFRGGLTAL